MDKFALQSHSFLQVLSRIAIIKTIEVELPVDEEADESKTSGRWIRAKVVDPSKTSFTDVRSIFERVYDLKAAEYFEKESDQTVLVCLKSKDEAKKALESDHLLMTFGGSVHKICFTVYEPPASDKKAEENKAQKEKKTKTELRIMLKRQVLRELIFDPDYNQLTNLEMFG